MRYCVLLILILLWSPVFAANKHAAALDQGTGDGSSQSNAMDFETAVLLANLDPGDVLYLYDDQGSFGSFTLNASTDQLGTAWTAGNYVTIIAGAGETPTFTKITWSLAGATQNVYWVFDDITIDSGATGTGTGAIDGTGGAQIIFQNCSITANRQSYTGIAGSCFYRNSYCIGFSAANNQLYPVHDISFINCDIVGGGTIITANHPNYNLTLDGCTIHGWGGDLYPGASNGFTFTDNTCYDNDWRRNVQYRSGGNEHGTFIVGNTVTQDTSGATGIVAETAAGTTYFHQTSVTDFTTATIRMDSDPTNVYVHDMTGISNIHGDGIQIIQSPNAIDGITVGNPTSVSASSQTYIKSGDRIKITGLGGADAAFLNGNIYYGKRIDADDFELYSDAALATGIDSTGKTITSPGYFANITQNMTISRNTFYNMEGTAFIYLQNQSGYAANQGGVDGCAIESNLGYTTDTSYGIYLTGVMSVGPGKFKINNNTIFTSRYGYDITLTIDTQRGSNLVDEFYNNIAGNIRIGDDAGGYSNTITSHDNNTFSGEYDPSNHWTNGASDVTNATLTSGYFTNYAGNDFTLSAGSPAIGSGSTWGMGTDVDGNSMNYPPDRGCHRYTPATAQKSVLLRN